MLKDEDATDGDVEMEDGGESEIDSKLGLGLRPMSLEEFEAVDEDNLPEDMRILIRVCLFFLVSWDRILSLM